MLHFRWSHFLSLLLWCWLDRDGDDASFASQNVAKVMMKENELPYSMASFKEARKALEESNKRISVLSKNSLAGNVKLLSHYLKF